MQKIETLHIGKGEFNWAKLSIQEHHIAAVLKKVSKGKSSVDEALITLRITVTLLYHRLCTTLEKTPNDLALMALIESIEMRQADLRTAETSVVQSLQYHFETLHPTQNQNWKAVPIAHMRYLAVCMLILCVQNHKNTTRAQITAMGISTVDTPPNNCDVQVTHPLATDPVASSAITQSIPPTVESTGPRRNTPTSSLSKSSLLIGIAAMGFASTMAIKIARLPQTTSTQSNSTTTVRPALVEREVTVRRHSPTAQTIPTARSLSQIESSGRFVSPSNPTRALFEIAIRTALAQKRDELGRCLSNPAHTQHLISGLTRRISDQLAQADWHVGDPHLPTGLTLQWTSGNCRSFHVIRWQMLGSEPRTERETNVLISANANDIVQQRLLLQRQRSSR